MTGVSLRSIGLSSASYALVAGSEEDFELEEYQGIMSLRKPSVAEDDAAQLAALGHQPELKRNFSKLYVQPLGASSTVC